MLIHFLLVLALLSGSPQSTKRRKTVQKPKETVIKAVENPALQSLKALRTMNAVAEIGGTYGDYTKRLAGVKVVVDEAYGKIPADDPNSHLRPKHDIAAALQAYITAAHYWDMLLKNKHPDLDASYRNLVNLSWQSARSYVNLAAKASEKKASEK